MVSYSFDRFGRRGVFTRIAVDVIRGVAARLDARGCERKSFV